MDPNAFSILTAAALLVSSTIFFAQTLVQARNSREGLFRNFNLLMTVFMLTWSVTELLEGTQAPFNVFWRYLHFVVMASFAVAITWRWRWTASRSRLVQQPQDLARRASHKQP